MLNTASVMNMVSVGVIIAVLVFIGQLLAVIKFMAKLEQRLTRMETLISIFMRDSGLKMRVSDNIPKGNSIEQEE